MTGLRKFLVAATALVLAEINLVARLIDGSEWVTATGLILGLYAASNVAARWVE